MLCINVLASGSLENLILTLKKLNYTSLLLIFSEPNPRSIDLTAKLVALDDTLPPLRFFFFFYLKTFISCRNLSEVILMVNHLYIA